MFKPCLEVPNKKKKAFDPKLCLVCQKNVEDSKRGRPREKKKERFDVFVEVCKTLRNTGDVKFSELQEAIKNKTADDLHNEKFCFHTQCRDDFQRLHSNQIRAKKREESTTKDIKTKTKSSKSPSSVDTPRVARNETISFNKHLCLFCQVDAPDESLYSVCQESRDQTLKDAFMECPNSLKLYKICSSHAYDAMAGDIKYHNSCWRDVIDKRVPENEAPSVSRNHHPEVHETHENTIIPDENPESLDESHSDQPSVGKKVELRNGRTIMLSMDTDAEGPDSSLKDVILAEIIEGLKIELSSGRAITLNNLVEIYKARMKEHKTVDPRTDKAIRIEFQRLVTKMDGVEIEKDFEINKCQKIYTKDVKAFALKFAEENSSLSNDEEIGVLKKASAILRRRTLKFMKDNPLKSKDFKVTFGESQQQFPPELTSFMDRVLFGQRKLVSEKSEEREMLTRTLTSSLMYNIKTDRQVSYSSKRKARSRHRYTPQQLAALALSIRHCERNNVILRLLSAPNLGITIPPRMTLLLETMIANAMTKIAQREGVYIPPNMERGTRVSFHIDNFDEQVQTFDGKNTVHYLLIVCFQRRIGEFKPIELKLEKTASLTLKDNSFADILPCDEPSNRQFKRTEACKNFNCSPGFVECRSATLFVWQCFRSLEHLLVKDEVATYVSDDINFSPAIDEGHSADEPQRWNLDSLKLPSFSATNSLVVTMDRTLTNIFPLPFIAGPASSTSAVFTSLETAHKTCTFSAKIPSIVPQEDEDELEIDGVESNTQEEPTLTRPVDPPPPWKTIIVLDLDLYSKAYKLVHSRSDLRNRYVLCLGELHVVFASLRAIGTFIDCSGLDDAWMNAKWFDSESLLRQVKDCSNMKRAIAAHEATLIAVHVLILQETLRWHDGWNCNETSEEIFEVIKMARDSIKQPETFKESWNKMISILTTLKFDEKIKNFVSSNKKNRLLQFLVKYCDMVTRLFTFIEATRSRNWKLHLDALEDMIPDFASMDRINYRRLSAVYIADMRYLENNDRDTWDYFMEGNFCCQKNDIPFTAIGRDHCGEQENKILKGRGGVSGQSSNSNSTNRYFMTAPILSQIYSEMLRAGGGSNSSPKYHHQLGNAYTQKQNRWVISLLHTFKKQKVSLSIPEDETVLCNIVTGQVFSDAIYENLVGAYDTGKKLYEDFDVERLKPESKTGIFAPLKKAMLKLCKSATKSVEIKYKDKVATLKEENIFIAKIAMIRGSRDVDMKYHIGHHELTPVIHSLMRRDGTLLDGWDGKSELAACVLNEANVNVLPDVPYKSECIAIDAMFLMNQISTKPLWVKTGSDLAAEFCKRVDQQSEGAEVIVIGFEWYSTDSLKSKAWKSRKKNGKSKTKNIDYNIEPNTDLTKRCMQDILGTIPTKISLTKLLMNAVVQHLKSRNVEYFVAGNGVIYSSRSGGEGVTNHKEGETSIILGLSTIELKQRKVVVYGNDVDLFVLLLAHYENIDCMNIQMKSLTGYTSITAVHDFLGHEVASALLPFHALTGCDVTGKFSGRTKDFWTKKFLAERSNGSFIQALLSLHLCQFDDVISELSKFICRSYCPKTTPKRITDSLVETRYFLYKKFSSETNKLPPSPGAFLQHLKRACCPLVVWNSANLPLTVTIDHLCHGWEMNENGILMAVCTRDSIAPEGLVELVSCNCEGDCSKRWCTCKKGETNCTDLCGCGDICQNTDAPPPPSALNDIDGEDEQELEEVDECTEEELEELEQYLQYLDELEEHEESD